MSDPIERVVQRLQYRYLYYGSTLPIRSDAALAEAVSHFRSLLSTLPISEALLHCRIYVSQVHHQVPRQGNPPTEAASSENGVDPHQDPPLGVTSSREDGGQYLRQGMNSSSIISKVEGAAPVGHCPAGSPPVIQENVPPSVSSGPSAPAALVAAEPSINQELHMLTKYQAPAPPIYHQPSPSPALGPAFKLEPIIGRDTCSMDPQCPPALVHYPLPVVGSAPPLPLVGGIVSDPAAVAPLRGASPVMLLQLLHRMVQQNKTNSASGGAAGSAMVQQGSSAGVAVSASLPPLQNPPSGTCDATGGGMHPGAAPTNGEGSEAPQGSEAHEAAGQGKKESKTRLSDGEPPARAPGALPFLSPRAATHQSAQDPDHSLHRLITPSQENHLQIYNAISIL